MNALSSIAQNIELLSKEKNIDPTIITGALEDAVVMAARKQFKTNEDLRARYNSDTGLIDLFAIKTVVSEVANPSLEMSVADAIAEVGEGVEPGDMLEMPRPMEDLGRIAAQTAKQIILQKVREAERNNIYEEYIGKVGELINGFVKRFEGGRMIVDMGNGLEAVMPKNQQSRNETFSQGERVRVVISDVNRESKGPQIEVSRTSPELLKRLFEMEVPEIYDGTVVIKAAVREPGDRAKIAVMSNERDVDPVGACVGMKGSRVQSIIRELRGEKIDIIEWSEDPAIFAANALSPAKVSKVAVTDFEDKKLQVTVETEQQSLAIGKRGQNVRLAARLVGWDIDIRSEEDMKREIAQQMEAMLTAEVVPVSIIEGITPSDSAVLAEHGIVTIEQLAAATVDELCEWLDLSVDDAEEQLDIVRQIVAAREEALAHHDEHSDLDATSGADEGEELSQEFLAEDEELSQESLAEDEPPAEGEELSQEPLAVAEDSTLDDEQDEQSPEAVGSASVEGDEQDVDLVANENISVPPVAAVATADASEVVAEAEALQTDVVDDNQAEDSLGDTA